VRGDGTGKREIYCGVLTLYFSLVGWVFENRSLRRIFGPKRDEVTGEWRKQHNEELSDLYSSPNIIGTVKSMTMRFVEKRNAYRLLVGKPEGRRRLGSPRRRWVHNIEMNLGEVGWVSVDWIGLA
jgi:hypothetical protein